MPILENRKSTSSQSPQKPPTKVPEIPPGLEVSLAEQTCSMGVTINIGNYNSVRYEWSATQQVRRLDGAPISDEEARSAELFLHQRVQRHVDRVAQYVTKHQCLPTAEELS